MTRSDKGQHIFGLYLLGDLEVILGDILVNIDRDIIWSTPSLRSAVAGVVLSSCFFKIHCCIFRHEDNDAWFDLLIQKFLADKPVLRSFLLYLHLCEFI